MPGYDIHDNGGRPFHVKVHPTSVEIFRQDYDENTNQFVVGKSIMDVPYKKLFIGDNDKNFPLYEKKGVDKGNSILLLRADSTYQFIGESIKTFKTIDGDKILNYYSPVGNNDVPYPYAVGEKYTYLMIERVYLPNDVLDLKEGPYEQYYGFVGSLAKKDAKRLNMRTLVKRR